MQDLVLNLAEMTLTAHGKPVLGVVGAVANPGAPVMLLIEPSAVLVERGRSGLLGAFLDDHVATPTDGNDRHPYRGVAGGSHCGILGTVPPSGAVRP